MIPHQKHKKARSRGKPRTDKSQAHISNAKGSKAPGPSGSEGSVANGPKGMAKRPQGTPIAAPGGRNSRAKTYGP